MKKDPKKMYIYLTSLQIVRSTNDNYANNYTEFILKPLVFLLLFFLFEFLNIKIFIFLSICMLMQYISLLFVDNGIFFWTVQSANLPLIFIFMVIHIIYVVKAFFICNAYECFHIKETHRIFPQLYFMSIHKSIHNNNNLCFEQMWEKKIYIFIIYQINCCLMLKIYRLIVKEKTFKNQFKK